MGPEVSQQGETRNRSSGRSISNAAKIGRTVKETDAAISDSESVLAQLDKLPIERQTRDVLMKELQSILDHLWAESVAMSNNEHQALILVQQLGHNGVSLLLHLYFKNFFESRTLCLPKASRKPNSLGNRTDHA